jgi:hypothetical protein
MIRGGFANGRMISKLNQSFSKFYLKTIELFLEKSYLADSEILGRYSNETVW